MSYIKKIEDKLSLKNKLKISGFLLGISLLLFIMSKYINGFANMYYKYVYVILVNTVSRTVSIFPFSMYEIILYGFVIYIFARLIIYIYLGLTKKKSLKEIVLRSASNFLVYISIFVFLNIIAQSLNSFKSDFVTLTGLKVHDSSEEQLIEICERLKDKLNELDEKIDKDENGLLKLHSNVREEGIKNMNNLGKVYPCLQGFYPMPKTYIYSKLMSYQLLEGETTFTIEANYNDDMIKYNIPSTICHELSHIRGFNNENEANYISFLACINSEDYEYQYSGYLMAYSYCMNDLYKFNKDAFIKINDQLSDKVKLELKNDVLYWEKYSGGISNLYSKVYDVLLKAGGQEDGIKSYNGVVKLLISGYKVQYFD